MRANVWGIGILALTAVAGRAVNHELKATPQTVVVGYYWSEAKQEIPPALDAIANEVKDRGPGGTS